MARFKQICDELAAIKKNLTDSDKVMWAMNGLGSKFEPLINAIMAKPPFPSYSQFIQSLTGYETRNKLFPGKEEVNDFQAFVAHKNKTRQELNSDRQRYKGKNVSFNLRGRGFIQSPQNRNQGCKFSTRQSNDSRMNSNQG